MNLPLTDHEFQIKMTLFHKILLFGFLIILARYNIQMLVMIQSHLPSGSALANAAPCR